MSSERNLQLLSRRNLMKAGLFGAVASGYVGLCVQLQPTERHQGGTLAGKSDILSSDQMAIITAIANCLCPGIPGDMPSASALDLPEEVSRQLKKQAPEVQEAVKLALGVIESGLVGLLSGRGYRPFTRQSASDQARTLAAFRDSPILLNRTIYGAMRATVATIYYGRTQVRQYVDYEGPPSSSGLRAGNANLLVDFDSLRGSSS